MEGIAEFAGNLQAELLNVRESLRVGKLTSEEAVRRIRAIRRRARSGNDGLRRKAKPIAFRRVVSSSEQVIKIASGSWDSLMSQASQIVSNLQPSSFVNN